MIEEWKDVKGYEGRYQVSNTGKVKSLERYVKNGANKYKLHKERLLKPIEYRDGYLGYGLRKDSKSTDPHSNSKAHWLVMEAFGEPKPDWATMINHIDGDKTNNYIDNLEWSNVERNNKHARDTLNTGQCVYRRCEVVVTDPLGNQLKYESVNDAARELSLSYGRLAQCAREGLIYKGYKARYMDNYKFDNSTKRKSVVVYSIDDDTTFHIFSSVNRAASFIDRSRQTLSRAILNNYACNGYRAYHPE